MKGLPMGNYFGPTNVKRHHKHKHKHHHHCEPDFTFDHDDCENRRRRYLKHDRDDHGRR